LLCLQEDSTVVFVPTGLCTEWWWWLCFQVSRFQPLWLCHSFTVTLMVVLTCRNSFCDAETKAPFPASYNTITISTPRLPRGSIVGPASSLLRERIHDTRRGLDEISRALLGLHLRLAGKLPTDDWTLLDRITFEWAAQVAADDKARQCSGFERLHGAQHPARL
jgi:hypothetical protein